MNKDQLVTHFTALVNAHDLTYVYADGGETYRRGEDQYEAIMAIVPLIGQDTAKEIWNANVEKKLQPFVWEEFKWL